MKHALIFPILMIALATMPFGGHAQSRHTKSGGNIFENPVTGEQVAFFKKSYALIIVNYDYKKVWPTLNDTKEEYRRLADSLYNLGFDTTIRVNLSFDQVFSVVNRFREEHGLDENDRVIIYYTGHGQLTFKGKYKKGWIVPVNAPHFSPDPNMEDLADADGRKQEYKKRQRAFEAKAIEFPQWESWQTAFGSKHVLMIFDCCFAGELLAEKGPEVPIKIQNAVTNQAREFLTAGDVETVPGKSDFLNYFLEAISGNDRDADIDHNGYLTTSELYNYLYKNVNAVNGTEPQRGRLRSYQYRGEFVFVLPKIKAPLPPVTAGKVVNKTPETTENEPIDIPATTRPVTNNLPKMILVEGGTFRMGCTKSTSEYKCEESETPHFVTVSAFRMSETEITNGQYCAWLNRNPDKIDQVDKWINLTSSYCRIKFVQGKFKPEAGFENYPVVTVSWFGADAYCKGAGGRLPTEAEWEFAARGGNAEDNDYLFPGSDNPDDVAWYAANSGGALHPVKDRKKPNALGFYDMGGNVWEWCGDWYSVDFYKTSGQTNNPFNNTPGSYRVIRGGSWGNGARSCRLSARDRDYPGDRSNGLGFRLVLVP